jgi:hypothetical protein
LIRGSTATTSAMVAEASTTAKRMKADGHTGKE